MKMTVIFLEQIAPGKTSIFTPELTDAIISFNNLIDSLVVSQSQDSSKVIGVNMSENWIDDYLADEVHYNEVGAKIVADRYYAAIEAHVEK